MVSLSSDGYCDSFGIHAAERLPALSEKVLSPSPLKSLVE